MKIGINQPSLAEMESILAEAERCIDCDAPDCFEFTPEGVDTCAELPYWNGKPVTKAQLQAWKAFLEEQRATEPQTTH